MADSVPGKIKEKCKVTDEKSSTEKDISLLCDPCDEDGKHKVAVGFCVNCQHYLCDNCFQYHCIPRPMKEHRLMNKDEMPKKKVKTVFSEVCPLHEGEAVKYYCLGHEAIGCNTCMLIDHKPCQEIRSLADVANDVEHSQLYKNFEEWIKRTEDTVRVQLGIADENVTTTKTCSMAVLENINTLQKKIYKKFNIIRAKIVKEANEVADRDAKRINILKGYVKDAQEKVDDMKHDIEMLRTTNQSKHLFIALQKSVQQQKILDKTLDDVKKENKVQKYEFVENGLFTNMMANIDDIGEIFFQDGAIKSPIFPVYYPEYGIPKYARLSKNSYVMADHICNRLCFFKDRKFVWEHKLSSGPWDITVVENGKVAITLPIERKIKFISVSDHQGKETQTISLNARCEGITWAEACLYVACSKPAKVLVLGMDGQVKKSIETSETVRPLFKQTAYITYHSKSKLLFVSDRKKNSISVLSLDGKHKAEYKTNLEMPLLLGFSDKCLVVSDPLSKAIWSVNVHTWKRQITSFENDDLEFKVLSLGYHAFNDSHFMTISLFEECTMEPEKTPSQECAASKRNENEKKNQMKPEASKTKPDAGKGFLFWKK